MNKRILGGLLCAAMLCAAPALAMPGMGEGKAPVDKFPMMDADKNGSVSKEEFKKFFPQMQDGAFAAIRFEGVARSGKQLFDYCDRRARQGYSAPPGSPAQ